MKRASQFTDIGLSFAVPSSFNENVWYPEMNLYDSKISKSDLGIYLCTVYCFQTIVNQGNGLCLLIDRVSSNNFARAMSLRLIIYNFQLQWNFKCAQREYGNYCFLPSSKNFRHPVSLQKKSGRQITSLEINAFCKQNGHVYARIEPGNLWVKGECQNLSFLSPYVYWLKQNSPLLVQKAKCGRKVFK